MEVSNSCFACLALEICQPSVEYVGQLCRNFHATVEKSTSTKQAKVEMPSRCRECVVTDCSIGHIGCEKCYAKLWRHFAHL